MYKWNNLHRQSHQTWLLHVSLWIEASRGNQTHLAAKLNHDRRRVSEWFGRQPMSVPAWSVIPISEFTGIYHTKPPTP